MYGGNGDTVRGQRGQRGNGGPFDSIMLCPQSALFDDRPIDGNHRLPGRLVVSASSLQERQRRIVGRTGVHESCQSKREIMACQRKRIVCIGRVPYFHRPVHACGCQLPSIRTIDDTDDFCCVTNKRTLLLTAGDVPHLHCTQNIPSSAPPQPVARGSALHDRTRCCAVPFRIFSRSLLSAFADW